MSDKKYQDTARYDQADKVNLLAYIQASGYTLKRIGREYMLADHDSLKINPDKNCFFWNSQHKAGGPVQFVMYVENKTRDESIDILIGKEYVPAIRARPPDTPSPRKLNEPLVLPEKNGNYKRLFAYLTKTRGIDAGTVSDMVKRGKLYESTERHNCVFVSTDQNGKPMGAFMRGTMTEGKPFKAEIPGGNKDYPFTIEGDTDRLYVYEAAIDALSDITLSKLRGQPQKNHHRIALGGVYNKPLFSYLDRNPQIGAVIFRTDNDEAGYNAVRSMGGELLARGLLVKANFPLSKDINQDLQDFRAREQDAGEVEL